MTNDTRQITFGYVKLDNFSAGFAADASDSEAAFLRHPQVPIDTSALATPVGEAAWRTSPSWAVVGRGDAALGEGMLLHMARRMKADITEVPGSPALFMTRAEAMSDVIHRAAQETPGSQLHSAGGSRIGGLGATPSGIGPAGMSVSPLLCHFHQACRHPAAARNF